MHQIFGRLVVAEEPPGERTESAVVLIVNGSDGAAVRDDGALEQLAFVRDRGGTQEQGIQCKVRCTKKARLEN